MNEINKPSAVSRSRFQRSIDDFVGKRYGAGEAFYGRRTSDMSDEVNKALTLTLTLTLTLPYPNSNPIGLQRDLRQVGARCQQHLEYYGFEG